VPVKGLAESNPPSTDGTKELKVKFSKLYYYPDF